MILYLTKNKQSTFVLGLKSQIEIGSGETTECYTDKVFLVLKLRKLYVNISQHRYVKIRLEINTHIQTHRMIVCDLSKLIAYSSTNLYSVYNS